MRYAPNGLRLKRRLSVVTGQAFQDGLVEIQDEGSQLVAALVDAQPGMQVADYCAGAGGKTLAMAAGMNNKGRVVAMDVLETRLDRSAQRLRRAGAHNVERRAIDADNRQMAEAPEGAFDRVLVDVPCTGTGTWRRNPDGRWTLRPEDLAELVPKQAAILDAASRLVKPGGGLVYATCSVLPAENERQIEGFLERHPEFSVVPVADVWRDTLSASRRPRSRPGRICACRRCSHGTDGFFAATLVRKEAPKDLGRGGGGMIRIRRASRRDAAAIGRVHVETWQSAYAGLLPDAMLAGMSDVRQAAWWSRALADPGEARGIFVADDEDMGVVGFGSCGPVRDNARGAGRHREPGRRGLHALCRARLPEPRAWAAACSTPCSASSSADGCDTAVLWMLAANPTRFFYEGLGGEPVGHRVDPMAGTDVEEVAYAWRDLDAPLVRRKLATEED